MAVQLTAGNTYSCMEELAPLIIFLTAVIALSGDQMLASQHLTAPLYLEIGSIIIIVARYRLM